MSKKSGFFYMLAAMLGFSGLLLKGGVDQHYQPEPNIPLGKRHKTFGKEITSYGKKPSYYKDKVLYQDRGDIIYVSPGHSYWATRALAEANR